jgi:hypothetical protein
MIAGVRFALLRFLLQSIGFSSHFHHFTTRAITGTPPPPKSGSGIKNHCNNMKSSEEKAV